MAPLADDDAVLQQHDARITPDDRLQRDVVSLAERIFRTCNVAPEGYLPIGTRR